MKQILLLLMVVTSMAYGQVSNTTATNFTNSLEASRIFNLPSLIATPPVGIKPGGLSYNTVFQKIAVWNGTSWVYLLSETNADVKYIKDNRTNIPEAKRISLSDSIKTKGVILSEKSLQIKIKGDFITPQGAVYKFEIDSTGSSRNRLFVKYNVPPVAEYKIFQFKPGGGAVAWNGANADSPGWISLDHDYVNKPYNAYYFGGDGGMGKIGFMNNNNYAFNYINTGRDALRWDSLGNVTQYQALASFIANGNTRLKQQLIVDGNTLMGSTVDNGAKLQVTGKATVSVAPTDPTGVVRLQDLPSPITVDAVPTSGSTNAVSSGGTFNALAAKAGLTANTFVVTQTVNSAGGGFNVVEGSILVSNLGKVSFPPTPSRFLGKLSLITALADGSAAYPYILLANPAGSGSTNYLPITGGTLVNDVDLAQKANITDLDFKQNLVTLTTTGSGTATFNQSTGALNIPTSITSSGTVTSVSTTSNNGISGIVSNPTTTPSIALTADTTALRTTANSLTKAQTQTALNTKAPSTGSANYIQNRTGTPQSAAGFNISGTGTIGDVLNLTSTSNTANTLINKLYFSPIGINVESSSIRSYFSGTNWFSGSKLSFYTNPGPDITSTNTVERMVILSNGNVGIGTPSPIEALDVVGKIRASVAPTNPTDVVRLQDIPSLSGYELTANKQNSLATDATNIKYPTVTAINTALANYVDKITNQTIGGSKTFNNSIFAINGIASQNDIYYTDALGFQLSSLSTTISGTTTRGTLTLNTNNSTGPVRFGTTISPAAVLTANRQQSTQDKDGVIALTSDLPQYISVPSGTTSVSLAGNSTYGFHATTLTTATLPVTNPAEGTLITLIGIGAGQFKIAQNASQYIVSGNATTTVGTTGYIQTTTNNTTITIRYMDTNRWQVTSSNSAPTVN